MGLLSGITVMVVDTETTGFRVGDGHRLVEVACVTVTDGRVADTWSSLVNPGRPIPPDATRIHHITDAMASGYQTQLLVAGDHLLGYFVAMMGVDEVHLLNITVAPAYQKQGWARVLLDALALWARGRGAQWLWLEVRVSNERALHAYQAQGFRRVGERKRYYPAPAGQREDAVVMSLPL